MLLVFERNELECSSSHRARKNAEDNDLILDS
jgi:hypothetical protein